VIAPSLPEPAASPLDQLRTVAGFGFAMAKADGRIATSERRQIRAFLERRYAPGSELMGKLDAIIGEVEVKIPSIGEALAEIRRILPRSSWPELYHFAVSVADAAGERNSREIECLARIAEELNAVAPPAPAPVRPSESATEPLTEIDCRAALEIAAETPLGADLIRRQYRLLSDRFAAERFTNHGPEFMQMAAEKRMRIERAARHLIAEYNEPLEPAAIPPPADPRHNPDLDEVFGV
jgi:uncharacterized tellurite resistance protein B-like protein